MIDSGLIPSWLLASSQSLVTVASTVSGLVLLLLYSTWYDLLVSPILALNVLVDTSLVSILLGLFSASLNPFWDMLINL